MSSEKIIPVNDLDKAQEQLCNGKVARAGVNYTSEEILRLKLASFYRLIDVKGWTQNIFNHITVRCEDNPDEFLINPFSLLYSEVTASNLIRVDRDGNIVKQGSSLCGVNIPGFILHKIVHENRKDVNCVIHVHTGPGSAVSCLKQGLLPVCQEALICGEISYYDYEGIVEERMSENIASCFSNPNSKVLILRNHGLITVGKTIEETWHYLMNLMMACNTQIHLMANGSLDHLIFPDPNTQEQVQSWVVRGINTGFRNGDTWGIGELEFAAEMRRLDRMTHRFLLYKGYKTGYPHRLKIYADEK